MAYDAGAAADDEAVVEIAAAVCETYGHEDAADGLTKTEILERIDGRFAAADVESRLDLFIRLELLRPILDKKHQSGYVLNPTGVVGLLVFERIGERGGVDELLHLLDRTRRLIESGPAAEATVPSALERLRGLFALFANEVARLVAAAPLDELLAERRFHDRAGLITQVASLNGVVTDQFPSDAVLISGADEKHALRTLQDVSDAVLVVGTPSDKLPDGIASAPPGARAFLNQLLERYEGHADRASAITDSVLGLVVIDEHDDPQTGRANRVERAERLREVAAAAAARATSEREQAVLEARAASADLEAARAAQQVAALEERLASLNKQIEAQERVRDDLSPKLEAAETLVADARLRVEAHEQARARADAVVELQRSEHIQASRAVDEVRRQKEALQVEYRERG